jgi:hypothetical protein
MNILFDCRLLKMLNIAIHSPVYLFTIIVFSFFLSLSPSMLDRSISPWRRQWRHLTCLLKHACDTFSPRSFSTRNSLKGILLVTAKPACAPSSHISFAKNPWLKYGADQRNVSDVDLFRVNQLPRRRRMQLFYSSVLLNSVFKFNLQNSYNIIKKNIHLFY